MPVANVDGIDTYYETHGSGTPILMCAPGGFDATIEKWRVASAWTGIDAIQALAAAHTVILYDRRECGQSGGRVERLELGELYQAWQSAARSFEDRFGVDHGRLHGLLGGARVSACIIPKRPAVCCCTGRWAVIVGRSTAKLASCATTSSPNRMASKASSSAPAAAKVSGWTRKAGPWAGMIARDARFARALC